MKYLVLPLLVLASGCCVGKCLPTTVYVPVPVAPPKPPNFEPLDLPMWHVPPGAPPDEVVRAHAQSELLLQGRLDACLTALDVYRVELPATPQPIGPPAPPR